MSDHHVLHYLSESPQSIAYQSLQPANTLLIFVHGFAGHPTKTWGDFVYAVTNHDEFINCDIIFYKYRSLKHHMASSALELYDCMDTWKAAPWRINNTQEPEGYQRIIFVAHSLGALVVRQVLLYAHRDAAGWQNKTRMLLFAPAHMGARIIDLCQKCLFGKFAALGFIAQWCIPVLGDLKEGSEPIKAIMHLNDDLLQRGQGEFTKAWLTVHAINDRTIIPGLYCRDPTPKADHNHDHVSVCKPVLSSFETPLEYLKTSIQA